MFMHEFSNHKNKLYFVCFLMDNFEELVILRVRKKNTVIFRSMCIIHFNRTEAHSFLYSRANRAELRLNCLFD